MSVAKQWLVRSREPVVDGTTLEHALAAAGTSLAAGRLVDGPNVERLEAALGAAWDRSALVTRSGMDALALAFEALGITGRDVFVPANCFANVPALACELGHRAVSVPIDPRSLALRADALRGLDLRDSVVVWVHHCGIVAPDAPSEIARLRGAGCRVIEDCAYLVPDGKPGGPGSWGDAAVLSFAATKPIPVGTGGALLFSDAALARAVATRRTHGGQEPRWDSGDRFLHDRRLDEMAAALALHQFTRLDEIRARLGSVGSAYAAALDVAAMDGRVFEPTWGKFIIALPAGGRSGAELAAALTLRGIETSRMYESPWADYPWFAARNATVIRRRERGELRELLDRSICLPYHERMNAADADAVVAAVVEELL